MLLVSERAANDNLASRLLFCISRPLIDFLQLSSSSTTERRCCWCHCWDFSTSSRHFVPSRSIPTRRRTRVSAVKCDFALCSHEGHACSHRTIFLCFQSFLHSQHRFRWESPPSAFHLRRNFVVYPKPFFHLLKFDWKQTSLSTSFRAFVLRHCSASAMAKSWRKWSESGESTFSGLEPTATRQHKYR